MIFTARFSFLALLIFGLALAGCSGSIEPLSNTRAQAPLAPKTLALMETLGTTPAAPVLIRAYKKEAVMEIWKQKADGHYIFFKTYPICRWSGQLGPKMREGDRQVPEGFYTITPEQMNPNSHYDLSFNVGYPNAYDQAWGRTGSNIMVHGICASAGCFSMTNPQVEEIYAIVREAFAGGQRAIAFQSYPFRMNTENFAKFRLDPSMPFWKDLKKGADYFEVSKKDVPVLICNRRYIFGAQAEGDYSATGPCPKLVYDPYWEAQVQQKAKQDNASIAKLVKKGMQPIHLLYQDGGQNPLFSGQFETSRPEALAVPPLEVALEAAPNPSAQKKPFSAHSIHPKTLNTKRATLADTPLRLRGDSETGRP